MLHGNSCQVLSVMLRMVPFTAYLSLGSMHVEFSQGRKASYRVILDQAVHLCPCSVFPLSFPQYQAKDAQDHKICASCAYAVRHDA